MYNTQVYLYDQEQTIILNDYANSELISVRWTPVYAKDLKLHKGTDNVITFRFINQDQKPVNLTNTTITFRLIAQNGEEVLHSENLEIISAVKGTAKVTIAEGELDTVSVQKASYSLERKLSTRSTYDPAFMDDNATARGSIEIIDSVMSTHTSSLAITIPAHGDKTTYYSSQWEGNDINLQTLQYKPSAFTGSIQVQGAVDSTEGLWYDIGSIRNITSSSDTGYINIDGFHPYLRVEIIETSGSIGSLAVR